MGRPRVSGEALHFGLKDRGTKALPMRRRPRRNDAQTQENQHQNALRDKGQSRGDLPLRNEETQDDILEGGTRVSGANHDAPSEISPPKIKAEIRGPKFGKDVPGS